MTLLLLSKLEMYVKCIKIHQQAFKAARDGKQLQLKKCLQLPIVSIYKEATLCKAKQKRPNNYMLNPLFQVQ